VAKGTTTLAFPSAEFPAQPGITPTITLQIPKDWKPVHTAQIALGAKRVAETGTFDPNVIVRIVRRTAGFETTDSITELKDYAATKPQGTTSEPYNVEIDGRQFLGCDVSWVDPKVGTVLQAHLFSGAPSGSIVELIQVIGGVGGAQAHEELLSVKAIMKTLTVGPK
jgi:hypothetical protein